MNGRIFDPQPPAMKQLDQEIYDLESQGFRVSCPPDMDNPEHVAGCAILCKKHCAYRRLQAIYGFFPHLMWPSQYDPLNEAIDKADGRPSWHGTPQRPSEPSGGRLTRS